MSLTIQTIDKYTAEQFLCKYHYSKIFPRITKHYLGGFDGDEMVAAMTLGWGTQPKQTIKKIFYNHKDVVDTKDYVEIGKMAIDPQYNGDQTTGSQFLAAVVKWMKQNTNYQFLYTLADGIMGKHGGVYIASNFRYIGKFATSVYQLPSGEKLHPRTAKLLLKENAEFEHKEKLFWLTYPFMAAKGISKIEGYMFRYMYPLTKKARQILDSYAEYCNPINPTSQDLKFYKKLGGRNRIEIEQPKFDKELCEYNYQKHYGEEILF